MCGNIRIVFFFAFLFCAAFTAGKTVSAEQSSKKPSVPSVVKVVLNGTVNPFSADFIKTAIQRAEREKAEAVVIAMDTPGGLLNSTKEIVKEILNSAVPVVCYVSPSGATATSAGAFIFLAAHITAMAPGTSIGAAQPVTAEGKAREGKAGKKIENFASSYIESIAKKRKRNSKWAIKAVTESSSVTWKYAVKKNIADMTADSMDSLLEKINGLEVEIRDGKAKISTSGAAVVVHEMTVRQRLGNILGSPDIAYLLLSLGSIGILIEIYNPGSIFPGVVGAMALLLAFASLQVLPFNYAGLGLIILGAGLMIAEVFVVSYGLLAAGGIAALLAGGVLLFDPAQTGAGVTLQTLAAVGIVFGTLLSAVVVSIIRTPKVSYLGGDTEVEGRVGSAVDWGNDGGIVFVGGEYWQAESDFPVSKGSRVVVVQRKKEQGLKIKVKPLTEKPGLKEQK